jgi:hypothetical protein
VEAVTGVEDGTPVDFGEVGDWIVEGAVKGEDEIVSGEV